MLTLKNIYCAHLHRRVVFCYFPNYESYQKTKTGGPSGKVNSSRSTREMNVWKPLFYIIMFIQFYIACLFSGICYRYVYELKFFSHICVPLFYMYID